MRSAITVCLVPEARQGPFVFHRGLRDGAQRAQALGFDAIEIFPKSAQDEELQILASLLSESGLSLAAMGTGAGWLRHQLSLTSLDPDIRSRAMEFIQDIIDVAGSFGASAIIGSMQGRVSSESDRPIAMTCMADALARLSERALRHGQPLLYEPLNRYETNLFCQQADAARWLEEQGLSNVKILADLYHMNIEESSLAQSIRDVGKDRLGHVHFADSNRRAIGMGHTEVQPIIEALREIHYQGYLSAEILPLPDPDAAARQTIDSYHRWIG